MDRSRSYIHNMAELPPNYVALHMDDLCDAVYYFSSDSTAGQTVRRILWKDSVLAY